jgi:hypothetical protein
MARKTDLAGNDRKYYGITRKYPGIGTYNVHTSSIEYRGDGYFIRRDKITYEGCAWRNDGVVETTEIRCLDFNDITASVSSSKYDSCCGLCYLQAAHTEALHEARVAQGKAK